MANSSLQRSRTAGSTKTKFTWSAWIKKSANNAKYLLVNYTDDSNRGLIQFGGSDEFLFHSKYSNTNNAALQTNRHFVDTSAWYNFCLIGDSTLATAGDRLKLYVNGVRETSFASETQISQNGDFYLNEATTNGFRVGEKGDGSDFFDGYMAHVVFLDGVAAAYTDFGETDSTSGIWKFKSPSGLTFGTNGIHLKFENSANLGLDSSGNTNNMSINGNLKQAIDNPSVLYTSLNVFNGKQQPSLSNGNTSCAASNSYKLVPTSFAVSKGKWYCEHKISGGSANMMIGIIAVKDYNTTSTINYCGSTANSVGYHSGNGKTYINNSNSNYGATYGDGNIIGLALDLDSATKTITFFKDGATQGAVNLPTNDDLEYYILPSPYNGTCHCNFGNGLFGTDAISSAGSNGNGSLFEYDVPSGHYALTTKNINTYG